MRRNSKNKPPASSLLDQLSEPLRDFVADFKVHGKTVLEQVREKNPEKYLELSAKLAALVATLKPEPSEMSKANSHEEIAVACLKQLGLDESNITPDMITKVIAVNGEHSARLEAIRDAAQAEEFN